METCTAAPALPTGTSTRDDGSKRIIPAYKYKKRGPGKKSSEGQEMSQVRYKKKMGCVLLLMLSILGSAETVDINPDLYMNTMRPKFGINYKFNGLIHHNLDRVWAVAKVKLPSEEEINTSVGVQFDTRCDWTAKGKSFADASLLDIRTAIKETNLDSETEIHWTQIVINIYCNSMIPWVNFIKKKEEDHKEAIRYIFRRNLYMAIPELDPRIKHSVQRKKRGIGTLLIAAASTLIPLGIEAISSHLQRKRDMAIQRALKAMKAETSRNENQMKQLGKDFLIYGKYQTSTTEKMIKTLTQLQERQTTLEQMFSKGLTKDQKKNISPIRKMFQKDPNEDFHAMEGLFAIKASSLMMQIKEEHDVLYRDLRTKLQEFVTGILKMAKGYLAPEIFPPDVLARIVNKAAAAAAKRERDYVLALPSLMQYYDMKLVTLATNDQHELIVTFPIFVTPIESTAMTLYELETVPVPINDLNNSASSFTEVEIHKPYIAINKDFYIQLRMPELRMCKKIRFEYYCEELFLVKHKSTASCESALFYNSPSSVIDHVCNFKYVYNRTVLPSVLDGGDTIILANMINQKKLICSSNSDLAQPLPSSSYVEVSRAILCDCKVDASFAYVLQSLGACAIGNKTEKINITSTINLAFKDIVYKNLKMIETLRHKRALNKVDFPISLPTPPTDPTDLLEYPKNLNQLLDYMEHRQNEYDVLSRENEMEEEFLDVLNTNSTLSKWAKFTSFLTAALFCFCLGLVLWLLYRYWSLKNVTGALAFMTTPQGAEATDTVGLICSDPWLIYLSIIIQISAVIYCLYKLGSRNAWWCKPKGYLNKNSVYIFFAMGDRYVPLHLRNCSGPLHTIQYQGDLDASNFVLEKNWKNDILRITWGRYKLFSKPMTQIRLPRLVQIPLHQRYAMRHYFEHFDVEENDLHVMIKWGDTWYSPSFLPNNIYTNMEHYGLQFSPKSSSNGLIPKHDEGEATFLDSDLPLPETSQKQIEAVLHSQNLSSKHIQMQQPPKESFVYLKQFSEEDFAEKFSEEWLMQQIEKEKSIKHPRNNQKKLSSSTGATNK